MQELKEAINVRYAGEASCCSNLSCGGALEIASPKEGEIFLDLGSGRGNDVLKAARLVGSKGEAIGVDFTKEMLELSEANRDKLKITNARFIESSIDSIPMPDNSIDVVISNCTINHSKDKSKVYSEIYRVLKAGGRVIVSDIISEEKLPEEVVNNLDAWAGCYGGAITEDEYFKAIHAGGFKELEVLEKSQPYEKGGVAVRSLTIRAYKKVKAHKCCCSCN